MRHNYDLGFVSDDAINLNGWQVGCGFDLYNEERHLFFKRRVGGNDVKCQLVCCDKILHDKEAVCFLIDPWTDKEDEPWVHTYSYKRRKETFTHPRIRLVSISKAKEIVNGGTIKINR